MVRKFNFICSVLFLFFCFLHYFSIRPLWLDENFVFQSLINFNYLEFFGPLKPVQSFPRVHLVLIKFLSQPFDYHVLSVRILSLIAMIAAFFVWIKHYSDHLFTKPLLLFCCLLAFACSFRLSYYAAEFKPYSVDVLAVACYAWALFYQSRFISKPPGKGLYLLSALLPLAVFFSYGALFVVWLFSFNFLLMLNKNRDLLAPFLINIGLTSISLALFYKIDLQYSITGEGLDYWYSYFLCTDSLACFFETLGEGIKRIAIYWYGTEKIHIQMAVIFIPFFLVGLFKSGMVSWKKDKFVIRSIDSLGFILFCEMVILGLLKKYPFTGTRLTLFFAPFTFYFIVKGIDCLKGKKLKYVKYFFLGYYICYCLFCLQNTFFAHLSHY